VHMHIAGQMQAIFGKIVLDSGSGLKVHFAARIYFLGFLFVMLNWQF
jgi:hypothetical protein